MPVGLYTGPNNYTGNGATTVFAYTYRVLSNADLLVTVDGVEKMLTTDYAVSNVGDASGGNVTFGTAPASGAAVVIQRNRAYQRDTDYQRGGSFDEQTVDADFDSLEMQVQQLAAHGGGTAAETSFAPDGYIADIDVQNAIETLSDVLQTYLWTKKKGVVADGVTLEQTAMQSAINEAITSKKKLMVQAGTILVGAALAINGANGFAMLGAGRDSTIIKASGNFEAVLHFNSVGTPAGSSRRTLVSDLKIQTTGTTTKCVSIPSPYFAQENEFVNVNFKGDLNSAGGSLVKIRSWGWTKFARCFFSVDHSAAWGLEFNDQSLASEVVSCNFASTTTGQGIRITHTAAKTFTDANVNTGTDTITITAHGYKTGDPVIFTLNSGSGPTGLTTGTAYYMIRVDDNNVKVATSESNAVAGTAIDLTATGSGTSQFRPWRNEGLVISNCQVNCGGNVGIQIGDSLATQVRGGGVDNCNDIAIELEQGSDKAIIDGVYVAIKAGASGSNKTNILIHEDGGLGHTIANCQIMAIVNYGIDYKVGAAAHQVNGRLIGNLFEGAVGGKAAIRADSVTRLQVIGNEDITDETTVTTWNGTYELKNTVSAQNINFVSNRVRPKGSGGTYASSTGTLTAFNESGSGALLAARGVASISAASSGTIAHGLMAAPAQAQVTISSRSSGTATSIILTGIDATNLSWLANASFTGTIAWQASIS